MVNRRDLDDTDAFERDCVRDYCEAEYGTEPRFRGDVVEVRRAPRWVKVGTVESIMQTIADEPPARYVSRATVRR
jgi:hypothetical protein